MSDMKRPRLLVIIDSLDIGGCEKHLLSVMSRLAAYYDITIYTTAYRGVLAEQFFNLGILVVSLYSLKNTQISFCARAYRLGAIFLNLLKHIHSTTYDIVHFFLPGSYLLGGLACILLGKKPLLMSRRSQNDYQKKHKIAAFFEKILHPFMRFIVANSNKILVQLQEEGVKKSQLRLIYNGVSVTDQAGMDQKAPRKRWAISDTALVFTIVANLFFYKGHADLLHALFLIREKLPDEWYLLCVGRDAGELNKLTQLTGELKLTQHVRWMGEQTDVSSLIAMSDIGVLVSHEEGFSNAILEFMMQEKPMVVTDVGGNAEAILAGMCGSVVPPRNIEAIAVALCQLALDPLLRLTYGKAARERVMRCFSLDSCVAAYDALYQETLKGEKC